MEVGLEIQHAAGRGIWRFPVVPAFD